MQTFGALTGSRELIELGLQANENQPVLYTHDNYGHSACHRLMQISTEHSLRASH